MPDEAPDDTVDPNVNDIAYQSATCKIEFDKSCFGSLRWQVFARNEAKSLWRHIASVETFEAAKAVSRDPERMEFGDLGRTEIDRRKLAAKAKA